MSENGSDARQRRRRAVIAQFKEKELSPLEHKMEGFIRSGGEDGLLGLFKAAGIEKEGDLLKVVRRIRGGGLPGGEALLRGVPRLLISTSPHLLARNLKGVASLMEGGGLPPNLFLYPSFLPLLRVISVSEALSTFFLSSPERVVLFAKEEEMRVRELPPWIDLILSPLSNAPSCEELMKGMRVARRLVLARLLSIELSGRDTLQAITGAISSLADRVISTALQFHSRALFPGEPSIPLSVISLGKLGGMELNYSSDLDLLFLAGEEGWRGEPPPLHELRSMVMKVVRTIQEPTGEGVTWPVDLNLRPDGRDGPLPVPLGFAIFYYLSLSGTFERAYLLKARYCAGHEGIAREFLRAVTPFVHRRLLDFSTIRDLRFLKEGMRRSMRPGGPFDLKNGEGGIRDIEFFVQSRILLSGGKREAIRRGNTIDAIRALEDEGLLPSSHAEGLERAYTILRHLEHLVQMEEDLPVSILPESPSNSGRLSSLLSGIMGWDERPDLSSLIRGLREEVAAICSMEGEGRDRGMSPILGPGADEGLSDEIEEALRWRGKARPPPFSFRVSRYREGLKDLLLESASSSPSPSLAVSNMLRFIKRFRERDIIISFLMENPGITRDLMRLFGTAYYPADLFSTHPELFEYLLHIFSEEPETRGRRHLCSIHRFVKGGGSGPAHPLQGVNALSEYRLRETLKIALAETLKGLDFRRARRYLTTLHREILLYLVKSTFLSMKGEPSPSLPSIISRDPPFLIVEMGSLATSDMTYGSDMDLSMVFHDDHENGSQLSWYSNLMRQVVVRSSTPTLWGRTLSLDLNLRPSGRAGPVASSLSAFRRYLSGRLDFWEVMALLKSNIPGRWNPWLTDEVKGAIGEAIRSFPFYEERVKGEIARLKSCVEKEIESPGEGRYNLKKGKGGIYEIELITLYLYMRYGRRETKGGTPLSIPGTLAGMVTEGKIRRGDGMLLIRAFDFLRSLENRVKLLFGESAGSITRERGRAISRAFPSPGKDPFGLYLELSGRVRAIFEEAISTRRERRG